MKNKPYKQNCKECGKYYEGFGKYFCSQICAKKSKEVREKISKSNIGVKRSVETRKKISIAGVGRIVSKETRKKISDGHKGIKHIKESKRKMSVAQSGKNNSMYGKHLSDETKRKISFGNKGKNVSKETRKKISLVHKGKKLSEETRKKISKSRIGINSGEQCHFWKGGITPENTKIRQSIEYRLWRESVFARDNWTCQKSNVRGCKLEAHHIKNFAEYHELRTSIENGITLSKKEHRKFHKKYGRKNNNEEQIKEFLNN